jgi:pantoate--beta-alanine ligase
MHSLSKLLRVSDKSIGYVPTMGALHDGHISLIRRSKHENDITIVSIYVNPLQFSPEEDYNKYPRQKEKDLEILSSLEVETVFIPENNDMWREDDSTSINMGQIGKILCGLSRPGHFDGVATVVAKLFNIVDPDRAYFGLIDLQQSVVIRQMVKELKYAIDIIVCPTARETDGLAMSSRNRYLSEPERKAAPIMYKALKHGKELLTQEIPAIKKELEAMIKAEPLLDLKYLEILDPENLNPLNKTVLPMVICLAATIGKARLIDNIILVKESDLPDDCTL